MSDFLSETEGCALLARLFKARGYAIVRNVMFHEYGVSFHIDGWDAKARVGFEFLTSEDEDHDDLTLSEYKTLMMAQQQGELSLFIIDEVEPLSAADLAATANAFLDEVTKAATVKRTVRPKKKAASAKKPAKKPAARAKQSRVAGKAAATKARGTKAATKAAVGKRKPKATKRATKKSRMAGRGR